MELKISNNSPIILVDGSYFIYHRFFATLKWYSFRNKEVDAVSCLNIDEFREALIKHTKDTIINLRKTWAKKLMPEKKKITKTDWESIPVWFAMDCHKVDVWRTELFNEYKGDRNMSESCDMRCFEMLYNYIRNDLEIPCMEIDGLEADDIIAITHKHLRSSEFTNHIVCITNDNDYLQLKDNHTSIYNLQEKDITTRSLGDPKKDLLLKIFIGDKSDKITAVRNKLTNKKMTEILKMYSCVEDILNELKLTEEEQKRFELNRCLIDFSYIPENLIEKYNTIYQIIIAIQ